MQPKVRQIVRNRAGNRCEYCHLPQEATPFIPYHVEHIIARQHIDLAIDDPALLALACDRCNAFKGPNLSSIDPDTGKREILFDPRRDNWDEHFAIKDGVVLGLSAIGRTTARLLNMNDKRRVELRRLWLSEDRLL